MHRISFILPVLILLFSIPGQANTLGCDVSLTVSPVDPDNVYCPDEIITLTAESNTDFDTYTWYYNFDGSNQSGTLISSGASNELIINISDYGFGYFFVEATNPDCNINSEVVLLDSWVFLSPVIASSGQMFYCEGDSSLISFPFGGAATYQWFLDGNPIPGATEIDYWVEESGTYTLTISYLECPDFFLSSGVGPSFVFNTPIVPQLTLDQGLLKPSSGTVLQWYVDGEAIEGANGQDYTPEPPGGTYTVEVVDVNGCIALSEPLQVYFTNTNTVSNPSPNIQIIPNPSVGLFNIQADQSIIAYQVLDARGIVLLKQDNLRQEALAIDLTHLANGKYWVQFIFENGQVKLEPLVKFN